jgi:L-lactate dehydrogenase (cytochrome)
MTERRLPRRSELRPLLQGRPVTLDPTTRRLQAAASLEDLRMQARRRTPRAVFDYTDGGANREVSLRRSREAFDRVEFIPSVLRDVSWIRRAGHRPGAAELAPAGPGTDRVHPDDEPRG